MDREIKFEGEYIWWSKDANLDELPEMQPATPEQLEQLEIERDGQGKIVSVRLKDKNINR